jgi:hypothetical protein
VKPTCLLAITSDAYTTRQVYLLRQPLYTPTSLTVLRLRIGKRDRSP